MDIGRELFIPYLEKSSDHSAVAFLSRSRKCQRHCFLKKGLRKLIKPVSHKGSIIGKEITWD